MVKFLDCGALWMREDKQGHAVYSGKIDKDLPAGSKIWVSPNTVRANDRQPTHRLSIITEDGPRLSDSHELSRWRSEKPVPQPVTARKKQQLRLRLPAGRRSGPKEFAGAGTDLDDAMPF